MNIPELPALAAAWRRSNLSRGLAKLDANGYVAGDNLGSGLSATAFLRGDQAWIEPGTGGLGNVVGPASATDNAIVRFDGLTGKLVQDSAVQVTDSGTLRIGGTGGTGHVLKQATAGGDVSSGTVDTADITDDAVTFAKIQNITNGRICGRYSSGSGEIETLSPFGGIEITGIGRLQTTAFTGDVTKSAGGTALTIANAAVTLAKMANIATDRLIGRDTAGTGVPEALTVSGGIEFTGSGGIQRSALTGDVTASAGSGSTTIANDAVTDGKLRNSAALSVIGRASNSTGDPADIAAGTDNQVLRRSGTSLAFGAVNLASSDAVTGDLPYANLTPSSAASRLLGRQSGSAGDWQEITLGTNLSMSGTTLNASGGGGGSPGGSSGQVQYNNGGSFGGVGELSYGSGVMLASGLELGFQSTGLDSQPWLRIQDGGTTEAIEFGSGTATPDVSISRAGAALLRITGQLDTTDGFIVPNGPVAADDGNFSNPVDGLLWLDTNSDTLSIRSGGTWRAL